MSKRKSEKFDFALTDEEGVKGTVIYPVQLRKLTTSPEGILHFYNKLLCPLRDKDGEFSLFAYMNLTRLRHDYPIYDCKGAREAFLAMSPEWQGL